MTSFENNKISGRQLQALLVLDLMGTAVITLPRRTAEAAGVDGWIGVIFGGVLLLGVLWMFITLLERHKGITVVELSQSLLGRPAGILLSVGLAIKLLITAGLELRIFCEMVNQTMLFRTPIWATAGAMAMVCLYVAAGGYECRGRAAEILFVLVVIPLILILIIAAFSADYNQLRPVFSASMGDIGKSSLITLFSFQGIEALFLVFPYLSEPSKAPKKLFFAGALLICITTVITLLTIAWFGEITVQSKLFPVLQMLDSINVPGAFWNRQDIFMIWFWTASIFASISAGLFFSVVIAKRIWKKEKPSQGKWLLAAFLIVYFTAVLPKSAAAATDIMEVVKLLGGGFYILLLPALLLFLDGSKGKRSVKPYVLLFLISTALLTGCYDNREMEDRDYIITLGIDKGTGNSRYSVALGSANLSALSINGEKAEDTKVSPLLAEGDSLASALRRADAYSSTQIYLGQLKTVVFGKELLEDKELMTSVLDELERNRDISEKIIVLGTEGTAADCIKVILGKNDSTGLFIWNFYKNTAEDVAVTEAMHLEDFLRILRNSKGQGILPKINLEQDNIRLGGGIALADYSLVGSLRDADQRNFLLMQGKGEGAVLEVDWESNRIPLWLYKNSSRITFSEEAEQLVCHIKIMGDGSIEGSNLLSESIFDKESIKKLENLFEKNIKTEIENTIKLARQDYDKDIFCFAPVIKRQNPDLYHRYWIQEDTIPRDMQVKIQVDITIRTVGMIE